MMKKTLIAVALVGALALAVGVSGFAYAQDNQPPTFPVERGGRFDDRSQGKMDGGFLADYMHDALANALGITPEELTALHESGNTMQTLLQDRGLTFEAFRAEMDDIRAVALAAAVADGVVPQEQAGMMVGRADRQGGFNRQDGERRSSKSMQGPLDQEVMAPYMHTALAGILGVSVAELDALHDSGDTIHTLLDANGQTFEEFGTLMTDARASAIAAALADGVITQEQADFMLDRLVNFDGMGPRHNFGQ
jgi:arsenate reductase-like glutaredoxin family protein